VATDCRAIEGAYLSFNSTIFSSLYLRQFLDAGAHGAGQKFDFLRRVVGRAEGVCDLPDSFPL